MDGLVQQIVVENSHGRHRLHHWYSTRQHTRIMTPFHFEHHILTLLIHRRLATQLSGDRLEEHTEINVLPIADASLNAPRMIRTSVDMSTIIEDVPLRTGVSKRK